eukprot:5776458-Pleurochrysis_carterae.AAC.1
MPNTRSLLSSASGSHHGPPGEDLRWPAHEADFITDKALREISGMYNPEEYTARADQLTSRATGLYSESVAWVEIDDDDRKQVVQ